MSLHYDVFNVAPKQIPSQIPGFEEAVGPATWPPSTSTLIWDDSGDSLVIDCLITTTEASELVEWIKNHGQAPSQVYITHPHADHMMGLSTLSEAFPGIVPIALAESIPGMEGQISEGAMQVWGSFFPGQLPTAPIAPGPLVGTTIEIGSGRANILPVGTTDTDGSTVVHIPDLDLIVAGDVVYNDTHMWLMGSTPESRANWLRALDTVQSLESKHIIAGHRDVDAPDDDARRQIENCRQYIKDFEVALAASATPSALIEAMMRTHSSLANPYTLWVAAFDLLGPKG